MAKQYDFKKEWPKIKKELFKMSQEAVKLAKKGEKELIKISHKGKIHLDSTALNLKREHLYLLIGKEYVRSNCSSTQSPKVKKLVSEVNNLSRKIAALKRKMKAKEGGNSSKKAKKAQS